MQKEQIVIMTLCRASDTKRAKKFQQACAEFGATGFMADLDDEPAQAPLTAIQVQTAVLATLPRRDFKAIFTHGPLGEYTRHRRHEECSAAVAALYADGRLETGELNQFAYTDDGPRSLPRPAVDAERLDTLSPALVDRKRRIMRDLYGFSDSSWEARAIPAVEAFYVHSNVSRLTAFMAARRPAP